jgi:hypothetical protein
MKRMCIELDEATPFDPTARMPIIKNMFSYDNISKPYTPTAPYKPINTFNQIIFKQNCESPQLVRFILEKNFANFMEFNKLISDYEFKLEKNYTDRLLKHILYQLAICDSTDSLVKFEYLRCILRNQFLPKEMRGDFLIKFKNAQRTYHILNRFAFMYKWKRSRPKIYADLCLDPISENQVNVMSILHNDQKYLFTIADMLRIIENSLCNSPYFFAEPLVIKNPYTNLPFHKSQLYYIYFFIKKRIINMSPVFHAYFMSNFSLKDFRNENGVLIMNTYIKQHIKNSSDDVLHTDILNMFKTIPYRGKIRIDVGFPKSQLIQIMRPYLEAYYISRMSNDISERNRTKTDLGRRLGAFYKYNKIFGRKFLTRSSANKNEFSIDHLPYHKNNKLEDFEISHLDIEEFVPVYSVNNVSVDATRNEDVEIVGEPTSNNRTTLREHANIDAEITANEQFYTSRLNSLITVMVENEIQDSNRINNSDLQSGTITEYVDFVPFDADTDTDDEVDIEEDEGIYDP